MFVKVLRICQVLFIGKIELLSSSTLKILELDSACLLLGVTDENQRAPDSRVVHSFWARSDWYWLLQLFKPSAQIENIVVLQGNKILFQSIHILINFTWKTCNYTMLYLNPESKRVKDGIAASCKIWGVRWKMRICIHFLSGNDGFIFCKRNGNDSLYKSNRLFTRTSWGMSLLTIGKKNGCRTNHKY